MVTSVDNPPSFPLTRQQLKSGERHRTVVLDKKRIWELEKKINVHALYRAVRVLEENLKERDRRHNISSWSDDLRDLHVHQYDFAHVLEHAILATIDNNISPNQLSTGKTYNAGINREKGAYPDYNPADSKSSIPHFMEIELSLAPVVPGKLQAEYVERILTEIESQFDKTGIIDLLQIKLN